MDGDDDRRIGTGMEIVFRIIANLAQVLQTPIDADTICGLLVTEALRSAAKAGWDGLARIAELVWGLATDLIHRHRHPARHKKR